MKFGLRLATLGLAFMVLFSILGLRLWFVQVAQGADIAEEAQELIWQNRSYEAPRGNIYDRQGELVVTSRYVPAVEVDRAFVTPDQRDDLVQNLSAVLGIPASDIDGMYEEAGTNGRFTVGAVSIDTARELATRLEGFPGVDIVKVPERVYLAGPDLAHVTGHLGLPTPTDLEEDPERDPTIRIGQLGVEKVYDDYLRGESGYLEYRVADGQIVATRAERDPEIGDNVYLAVDLELQEVVKRALVDGIELANEVKRADRAAGEEVQSEAERAAAVVMDVNTGEVLSLVSVPSFDPQQFVSGLDQATFDRLRDNKAFNNLAVSGLYPPASTFKAITYAAAEQYQLPLPQDEEGVDPANRTVHCDGEIAFDLADGSQQVKHDWYTGDKGWLDIHNALEQSCNLYFWSIGLGVHRAYQDTENQTILQDFAASLGYGKATGIDLTSEAEGIVPTPQLFREWKEFQLANPDAPPRLDASRLDLPGGPFLGGDLMDFAIGQGALLSTPLQVAVSYGGLATGTLMEPAVVTGVKDSEGEVVFEHESETVTTIDMDRSVRESLLTDLGRVVTSGTARAAFADFGPGLDNVGGKTGTAETTENRDNHAWFVGVAPLDDPDYVVVVLIDEGGSGGQVAAPVARHILQYLMGNEPGPIVQGEEAD